MREPAAERQGPNAPRKHDFAAREVAAALVALARGATYAEASRTARHTLFEVAKHWPDADRPTGRHAHLTGVGHAQPGQRGNETSTHGTLVATWVEAYTDVVLGPEEVPTPQVLLLDSTNFHRRYRGRRDPAFAVVCAYGYDADTGKGRLLRARAYRAATAVTPENFLDDLAGVPEVVLSDGGPAVIEGIAARWPEPGVGNRPERVRCRRHLAKNLRAPLVKDIKPHLKEARLNDARHHPLWQLAERAFDSLEAFEAYGRLALAALAPGQPRPVAAQRAAHQPAAAADGRRPQR